MTLRRRCHCFFHSYFGALVLVSPTQAPAISAKAAEKAVAALRQSAGPATNAGGFAVAGGIEV